MIIKICGLREPEHAVRTAALGADLLGFVFAKSPRQVTPEQVRKITAELPASVKKVGVFVDEDHDVVNDIVSFCGLDMVQLHGSESPDYCNKISCQVIKAFRVKDSTYLDEIKMYVNNVELLLLDTYMPGVHGGTGKTFDWSLAQGASELGKVILAGGLTPENVALAVKTNPFGIDVSGGVETNGVKDLTKIELFIKQARRNQDDCIAG